MADRELPTLMTSTYAYASWGDNKTLPRIGDRAARLELYDPFRNSAHNLLASQQWNALNPPIPTTPIEGDRKMSTTRVVKIFIADTNENLPLGQRLLYTSEEKLTELTDQELFFEVPINDLLTKHNCLRMKTLDKKQAEKFGRDVFLEPARIRDLRMLVATVAQF